MKINRKKFYEGYRAQFGAIESNDTVESINAILEAFENSSIEVRVLEKLAYALATVRHEVGEKMLPIVENMNYTSIKRIRQVWPSRFPTDASARPYVRDPRLLGNRVYGGRLGNGALDGYKFRGRGIGAQITGYDSYKKFGDLLGLDLVSDPDLAMNVNVGAKILELGFNTHPFTGYKISNSINNSKVDYVQARRTVNADVGRVGESVAKDARKFEKIIRASIEPNK